VTSLLNTRSKRRRLPSTITIDSIHEKNFLSPKSVLEAVVINVFVLPGILKHSHWPSLNEQNVAIPWLFLEHLRRCLLKRHDTVVAYYFSRTISITEQKPKKGSEYPSCCWQHWKHMNVLVFLGLALSITLV
jgi:uncharacterized protein with HEPN domain